MHHEPTSGSCISSACPTGKKNSSNLLPASASPSQMMRHSLYGASSAEKSDAADKVRDHLKRIMQMRNFVVFFPRHDIQPNCALPSAALGGKKKKKREREKPVHRLISIFTDRGAFFTPSEASDLHLLMLFFFPHVCRS